MVQKAGCFLVLQLRHDKLFAPLCAVEQVIHFALEEGLEISVIFGDLEQVDEAIEGHNVLCLRIQIHKLVVLHVCFLHGLRRNRDHLVHEGAFRIEVCEFRLELRQLVLRSWQVILEC